jgi:hypothetical protein
MDREEYLCASIKVQLEVAVKSYSEHSLKRHYSLNIVSALAIALSQVQEQDRV